MHGGCEVVALEMNPDIVALMRGPLAEFSGSLYDRAGVTVRVAEARGYLAASDERKTSSSSSSSRSRASRCE